MSLETELRTLLLANAGVSALIGTRLRPLRLQDNETLPATTYQRVVTTPWNAMSGAHDAAGTLMQLDSYAEEYADAEAVSEAIQTALDGVQGNGNIQAALMNNRIPVYDADLRAYRVIDEYRIHYTVE